MTVQLSNGTSMQPRRRYFRATTRMNILAGDIGGTKTLMQLASLTGDSFNVICEKSYPSADHPEFTDVLLLFLKQHASQCDNIEVACFGVAGPISQNTDRQTVQVTNLPWRIDTQQLKERLAVPCIHLINDFQAVGYGIETLQPDDLHMLQTGKHQTQGPRIVLGAGTGLGVGQLVWQQDHYVVLATEGGHIDFAPTTPQQMELLSYLSQRFGHVSYERVLSGPGIATIYEFLRVSGNVAESPALREEMQRTDPAAAITEAALINNDRLANETLELFISIYGAMAGNLALINLAFGGVYVAGGIAPRIIDRLSGETFVRAFNDKGRMASLLASIPVAVVMNPKVGLRGAAQAGYHLARGRE